MSTEALKHPLLLFQWLLKKIVRDEEICNYQDTDQKFHSQGSFGETVLQNAPRLAEASLNRRGELHRRLNQLFLKLMKETSPKNQGK